jgi:competence protein ComEA
MFRRASTYLAGLVSGLLASGLLYLMLSEPRGEPIRVLPPPTPRPVSVHVVGAVRSPGVYQLPRGAIVQDALAAAGGPSARADLAAINLAAGLADSQQVYVPFVGETPAGTQRTGSANLSGGEARLNVNTATAQAIVEYRESHGPFQRPEGLLDVPGIGPAKLAQIKDLIAAP